MLKKLRLFLKRRKRGLICADYYYNVNDWETTHYDVNGVEEQVEYDVKPGSDRILEVGRLVSLSVIYGIQIPTEWPDGEPEEWEYFYFETPEKARAARELALTTKKAIK